MCLDVKTAPLSFHRRVGAAGGFDLALSHAVAARLGRTLQVQWHDAGGFDADHAPELEANALLSAGLCDLLGGYALYAPLLGPPSAVQSGLPDYDGAAPAARRRRVMIGTLAASRAVRFAPMTAVLGPSAAGVNVSRLADLAAVRIGVAAGTLSGTIVMLADGGALAPSVVSLTRDAGPLAELEAGRFDATLIELNRLEAWRAAHTAPSLRDSLYRSGVGFNMGFVALQDRGDLLNEANAILDALLRDDTVKVLAQQNSLTYVAPRPPAITPPITGKLLAAEE